MTYIPAENEAPDNDSHLILAYLKSQQNLTVAIFCGLVASLIGAAVWALVTVVTGYQIGWIAVGVGFIVGYAVRMGRGFETKFGIIGALLALFGCVLGHFFTIIGMVSDEEKIGLWSVVQTLDYSRVPEIFVATTSPMDFLFYGIALYEGFKFSVKPLTEDDLRIARKILRGPLPEGAVPS